MYTLPSSPTSAASPSPSSSDSEDTEDESPPFSRTKGNVCFQCVVCVVQAEGGSGKLNRCPEKKGRCGKVGEGVGFLNLCKSKNES